MHDYQAELVLDAKAILGEGPIWDSRQSVLWWIDINRHQLHRFDPSSNECRTINVGQRVGTVVPRSRGGLMLALQHGFATCDFASGDISIVADPEAHIQTNRFNDGKCDPGGRFWAGTLEIIEEDMQAGSLYCLHANGRIDKQLEGVGISNGIVWTSDCQTMYYIDTPTRKVDAFNYNNETGAVSDRREAFSIPQGMGYPDGMTIDEHDHLWVALWGGWAVACFDPSNGELLAKVSVPASQVTACAFGGLDLKELFITTASRDLTQLDLEKEPQAGGLFRANLDVAGVVANEFAG